MKRSHAELLLMTVIILRSTSYLCSKVGLDSLPPLELLAIRFSLAFVILAVIFRKRIEMTLTRQVLHNAVIMGGLLSACMSCELISLTMINSSTAAFLENTAVAWVLLLGALRHRRLPNKLTGACTLAIFCGIALLTLRGTAFQFSLGEGICLCASLFYAVWLLATNTLSRQSDPLVLGIVQFGVLACFTGIGAVLFETPVLPAQPIEWEVILVLTFVCTIFGFTFQPVAQRYTTAEKAGLFSALNPLVAAILGWLVLQEEMGLPQIAGSTLILTGIILLQTVGKEKEGTAKNTATPKLPKIGTAKVNGQPSGQ